MTDEDLDRLEKLAAKAAPGPWVNMGVNEDGPYFGQVRSAFMDAEGGAPFTHVADTPEHDERNDDMEFIAAARLAVPDLIAAVRAERDRGNRLTVECEQQAALVTDLADALREVLRESADGVFAPGYRSVRQAQAALEKVRMP